MQRTSTPKFHGDDPKIWVRQCEDYFSLYDIQEVFKTRFATLNFRGKAALWLEHNSQGVINTGKASPMN